MIYVLQIAAAWGGTYVIVELIGSALTKIAPRKEKSIALNVYDLAPMLATMAAIFVFLCQLDQILS